MSLTVDMDEVAKQHAKRLKFCECTPVQESLTETDLDKAIAEVIRLAAMVDDFAELQYAVARLRNLLG